MSERTNGLLRSIPVIFIGQVAPRQEKNKRDLERLGSRVRVRIMGIHSPDGNINPDETLDYAHVLHPNSHGHLNMSSTGIIGGEMVIGMFLRTDGTTLKDPVILGVLPKTYGNDELITADESDEKKSTEFKKLYPFWGKIQPQSWQIKGGEDSSEEDSSETQAPAPLEKNEFFKSTPQQDQQSLDPDADQLERARSRAEELEREQLARIRSLPEPTGDVIDWSDAAPDTRTQAQIDAESAARRQRIVDQIGEEEYLRRQRAYLNR